MENEYRSTKMGDIQKCPNCGAVVETLAGKCKECGYEFRNVGVISSAKEFTNGFMKLNDIEKKKDFIKAFQIPTAKEDLFTFVTSLKGLKNDNFNPVDPFGLFSLGSAFSAKYDECMARIRMLYPEDSLFKTLLVEDDELNARREKARKYFVRYSIMCLIVSVVGYFLFLILHGALRYANLGLALEFRRIARFLFNFGMPAAIIGLVLSRFVNKFVK